MPSHKVSLKPVIEKYAHNSARTWITYKGKLISTKDKRILWEREVLYSDPKCENVEEMQEGKIDDDDLLKYNLGQL